MFEFKHAVYSIQVNSDEVGFAVAISDREHGQAQNLITVEIIFYNNPYFANPGIKDAAQVSNENPEIIAHKLIKNLLGDSFNFNVTAKRISFKKYYKNSNKYVYLTKDYTLFSNKTFVNINNEKHLDFGLNDTLDYINDYLTQHEELN